MDWKYKLKHMFANRYAMTAVLFLAITAWGCCTVFFGILEAETGCKGYTLPKSLLAKGDPAVPGRELAAGGADLSVPAPVEPWADRRREETAAAEAAVTKALEEDHSLIELFGAFQDFSTRTVVEDAVESEYTVAKLSNGSLTFIGEGDPDPKVQASELKRLQTALEERDISLLYIQAPSKLEPGVDMLPYGLDDPSNDCADRLLAELEEVGVDSLDLRQTLKEAGGEWGDWFYKTDHHWNQEAAFLSFQTLAKRLENYRQTVRVGRGTKRQSISIPPRYTDSASYDKETLSRFFLGSQGKRVGTAYVGVDDFVLWTPNFPTLLHYTGSTDGDRYGELEETVIFTQRVEKRDYYGGNPYSYNSGGDYAFAQATNYYNPGGPKIMLIRDSYSGALTPYLALACSQLTTIDPRRFAGDLLSVVEWVKPDVVVVLYSSGMVRQEDRYHLLAKPAGPSKADVLRWRNDD